MFIRPMSDLHLEFKNPFVPPPMEEDADSVLVLAGDIHNGTRAVEWIKAVAPRFKHVVYVLGNHDYWTSRIIDLPAKLREEFADSPNISILQNDSVVVEGVRFLGGTLWTDFDRENERSLRKAPEYMVPDYKYIRTPTFKKVRPEDILKEHKQTRGFLVAKFQEPFEGPTVVVTHHGPSQSSIHPRYYYAQGNEYYVSDLEELLYLYQPKYWLHGHTHESLDYIVDQTRVVVNPFGYHGYQVNESFQPELRLEI